MWPFYKKTTYTLTPTQELLLALLRAQLWLKPVDDIILPFTIEEWDELINLGYKQTVICFIAKACLRHPKSDDIPTDIREEFEAVLEENAKIHEQHNAILIELITKFEEQGLHPILLKGQGTAMMYGDNSELRQCGDIDLYFCPDEYERAKEYIVMIQDSNAAGREDYKHYDSKYRGVEVEVHRRLVRMPSPFMNNKIQQWTVEAYSRTSTIEIKGKKCLVFDPIFSIVYNLIHILHHLIKQSISLRQITDIMMLYCYYENTINRQTLRKQYQEYKLNHFWCILEQMMVKFFLLTPDIMLYSMKESIQSETLLCILFERGSIAFYFGNAKKKSDLKILRKAQSIIRFAQKQIPVIRFCSSHVLWYYVASQASWPYRIFCGMFSLFR